MITRRQAAIAKVGTVFDDTDLYKQAIAEGMAPVEINTYKGKTYRLEERLKELRGKRYKAMVLQQQQAYIKKEEEKKQNQEHEAHFKKELEKMRQKRGKQQPPPPREEEKEDDPGLLTRVTDWFNKPRKQPFFKKGYPQEEIVQYLPPRPDVYLEAREQFLQNVRNFLAPLLDNPLKPPCDLQQYFNADKGVLVVKKESASASHTALVELVDLPGLSQGIDRQFYDQPGFRGLSMKIYLKPGIETFDNSLDFEERAYNFLSKQVVKRGHSPHVISHLATFPCEIGMLKLGRNNDVKGKDPMLKLKQGFKDYADERITDKTKIIILLCEKAYDPYDAVPLSKNEIRGGSDLGNRMDNDFKSTDDVLQVLWQLIWTLEVFSNEYFRHNDLHMGNIFIEDMGPTPYRFWYTDEHRTHAYCVQTRWFCKIFDFDHGSLLQPVIQRNMINDQAAFCDPTGTAPNAYMICNRIHSTFDIHGVMMSFLEEGAVQGAPLCIKEVCKWILKQLPPVAIDDFFGPNRKARGNSIRPQYADNAGLEMQLKRTGQKLKTPYEYRMAFVKDFPRLVQTEPYTKKLEYEEYVCSMNSKVNIVFAHPRILPEYASGRSQGTTNDLLTTYDTERQTVPITDPRQRQLDVQRAAKKYGIGNTPTPLDQAIVELTVDVNIDGGSYDTLIRIWCEELNQLKEDPDVRYDWGTTVSTLILAYEKKKQKETLHPEVIALNKAAFVICAPMFYGMPARFRRRLLLQIGKEAYLKYIDIFKVLDKRGGIIQEIEIPMIHLWDVA